MQGNPKAQTRGKGSANVSLIRVKDEEELDDDAPLVVDDIEEEYEVMDLVGVNAARIEKPKTEDKWKNTKTILKRRLDEERDLAVPRAPRSSNWRPVTIEEQMDVDNKTAATTTTTGITQSKSKAMAVDVVRKPSKLVDLLKSSSDPQKLLNKILDQPVQGITIREVISCSDLLQKLMFKSVSFAESTDKAVSISSVSTRSEVRKYVAATPKVKVRLEGTSVTALIDTGAEVNVMTKGVADALGLPMRADPRLTLIAHTGHSRPFDGVYEDVEIDVGGVKVR